MVRNESYLPENFIFDGFGMKILQIMSDYNWECIVKNKFIIYQYRCS